VTVTLGLSALYITLSDGFESETERLTSEKLISSPSRIAMWKCSMEMFKDYPLLGVGGGNWKIHISKYGIYDMLKTKGKKRYQRSHNDYLSILTENGIFGFLAFAGFLFLGLFYLVQIVFLIKEKEEKLFYLFLFSGLTGYMVFSFFDFPKERTELNIYLLFILSVATAKYQDIKSLAFRSISANRFLFVILPFLLVLGMALFFGIKRINGEIQTKKAIDALHSKQYTVAIDGINKSYSRYYEMDPTSTPVLWYKGLANFRKGNRKKALNNFFNASLINPYHSHIYNSMAVLYASEGDFINAKKYFLKSIKLRPYASETIVNLAKLHLQNNNYDSAYYELRKVNLNNNRVAYKTYMVKVLERKIDQLADSISDEKIHSYILKLKTSKPNTLEVYKTSRNEGHTFKQQFLNQVAVDLIQNDNTLSREQLDELNSFLFREIKKE
jgi:tetratricopeptide (TPR) repeat protein